MSEISDFKQDLENCHKVTEASHGDLGKTMVCNARPEAQNLQYTCHP